MGGTADINLLRAKGCIPPPSTPKSGQRSATRVMAKESDFTYADSMQTQDKLLCASRTGTTSRNGPRSALQVLYVDGCEPDLIFTQLACEHCRAPFEFVVARSVEEALCELEAAEPGKCFPDLILLEIMTEGQSGFEILELLRTRPQLARIPVVVLTGTSDPNLLARARQLGATYLLQKEGSLTIGDKLVQAANAVGLFG